MKLSNKILLVGGICSLLSFIDRLWGLAIVGIILVIIGSWTGFHEKYEIVERRQVLG